jgi:hypothetical protein
MMVKMGLYDQLLLRVALSREKVVSIREYMSLDEKTSVDPVHPGCHKCEIQNHSLASGQQNSSAGGIVVGCNGNAFWLSQRVAG